MPNNARTEPNLIRDAKRREAVAKLRARGYNAREITAMLPMLDPPMINPDTKKPYVQATVVNDIQFLLGEWRADAAREIAEHQAEQMASLREVQREAWREKDFDLVLKAHDRIARILGTDAPTKQEVAISTLDPQTVAAAIERVTKIIEKAEAKGQRP